MFLMMSVISVVPLSWLLKLEKVDQTKLKAIGRKKKSPWNKSWLFEKTKKIDKYLASLTMKKKVFELLESEIKWGQYLLIHGNKNYYNREPWTMVCQQTG